ncbi:hypothetical protein HZH68_011423 [Vespula germanica]|uniref:Uncharacterized protein n=1 Tax=Vespula germanica TaxID=30212 RepID=A0A834N121_VESGE|nr:hypothetical protein HZH68_011423 [Vespula germanica]
MRFVKYSCEGKRRQNEDYSRNSNLKLVDTPTTHESNNSNKNNVLSLSFSRTENLRPPMSHHSDCFPYVQDHVVALFRGHALCIVVLMEIENPRVARGIDRASAEVGGFAPLPSPFSPKYPATSNFPPPFIPTITYTPLVPSLATVPAPTPASSSTVKGFARRESGKLDFLGRRRREEDEKRRKPRE